MIRQTSPDRRTDTVVLDEAELATATWGEGPAEIVLLHDGLGSIDQWRDIPAALAKRTGRPVLAYDRPGHGRSTPVPDGPWPADWLHREAERLARFLDAVDVADPVLVGHSDGGSIALLHAVTVGRQAEQRGLRGVVTLAAHSWVEQRCYDAIVGMRERRERFVTGLAPNHQAPDKIFEAWSGVWVSDEFRPWDIRPRLGAIDCPTLVAQGTLDEYATEAHATETAAAIGANATCRLLDGVGHLLHHQDPDLIVDVVAEFDHINRR